MRELGIARVGDDGGLERVDRDAGEQSVEPARELGGAEHAAHRVRLGEARREEVLARGLVGERAGLVTFEECPGPGAHQRFERARLGLGVGVQGGGARPVEHQGEAERALAVLAGSDREGELGQPRGEPLDRRRLERAQGLRPPLDLGGALGSGVACPLAQLGGEAQEPRETVGPLEARAPVAFQVARLGGELLRRQARGERRARPLRPRRLGREAQEPRQEPVAVHRGVPVEAAEEGRGQLARRARVGVAVHHVRDLVRVLAGDAGERELHEARGLGLVERRRRRGARDTRTQRDGSGEDDRSRHGCPPS